MGDKGIKKLAVIANEYRVSFQGDGIFWEFMVIISQPLWTWIIHFQRVNLTICKLYLSIAIIFLSEQGKETIENDKTYLKREQIELNNLVVEIKNSIDRLNHRLYLAGRWINELEDRSEKITRMQHRESRRWEISVRG